MTFQAYLDAIQEKTGNGPKEFIALARDKRLLGPEIKAGDVIAWLAKDFDLGRGHAMAIYAILKAENAPPATASDRIAAHFKGANGTLRATFERLRSVIEGFGNDVVVSPTGSYLSFVRRGKKFAIVKTGAGRMEVGIKLKGAPATKRFRASGTWNAMVTHRVTVEPSAKIDAELGNWLKRAYDNAG